MSDKPFDMPDASHTFEERGGWVVNRFCADLWLQQFQSAGIVGNLGFESGGFKALQEIGVSGYERGGFGWEMATGPRRRALEAWAAAHNLAAGSPQVNYGFILDELRGPYRHVVELLKLTTTLEAAVFVFGVDDEAPGGTTPTFLPGDAGRLAYARRALAGATAIAAPVAPPNGPAPVAAPTGPAKAIAAILAAPYFRQGVWEFQAANGLNRDGIIGPDTLRKIGEQI